MSRAQEQTTELDDVGLTAWGDEAYVVVADGPKLMAVALAKGAQLVIGRADDADIVLEDGRASRHHARVESRDGRIVLVDLGSTNGTRVGAGVVKNGEAELRPGDVVHIGLATLTLACARESASADAHPDAAAEAEARGFVMADPAMLQVFRIAERFACVDMPVLVLGETGVGKEVVAAQMHAMSERKNGRFVTLNCAALPETIMESELFGHEKGAFTGAERRKIGFLEAANGGTLLLDELGDMPITTQVKLLRFLETHKLTRLGSTTEVTVDVRVVGATHRDLQEAIRAGRLREDLYYRLSACTIKIPPLRARPAEIAPLAALFARSAAKKLGMPPPSFEAGALAKLVAYPWPGNVREMRNVVEHAVVMSDGRTVRVEDLPESVREAGVGPGPAAGAGPAAGTAALPDAVAEVERGQIARVLEEVAHNQTKAAAKLGISRRALLYKMAKYDIRRPQKGRA